MSEKTVRQVVHTAIILLALVFSLSHGNLHTRVGELEQALEIAATEIVAEAPTPGVAG